MNLEFRAEGHEYLVDGIRKPSITQVLGAVKVQRPDGIASSWYDYSFLADEQRDAALARGSWTHDAIALRLRRGPLAAGLLLKLEDLHPDWFAFYRCFENWFSTVDFKPLLVEQPLYSPTYGFCGTPDVAGLLAGDYAVIDFKTSAIGDALPETAYQTAAQALLLKDAELYPARDQTHRRFSLTLNNADRPARLVEYTRHLRDRTVFLAHLTVYQEHLNGNGSARNSG